MSGVLNNTEGIAKGISHRVILVEARVEQTFTRVNKILTIVDETFNLLKKSAEEDHSDFFFSKVQVDDLIIEGRITKIAMNEFQQVSATYSAEKKDGRPAKVQNPRLETDRPEIVIGELDEAKSRVTLRAKKGVIEEDTPVAVKVIADADLGDGVKEIEIVGSLLITPGQAEKLTLNFEEPVDRTDAPGEEETGSGTTEGGTTENP